MALPLDDLTVRRVIGAALIDQHYRPAEPPAWEPVDMPTIVTTEASTEPTVVDAVKSAAWSALWAAVAGFCLTLLAWLGQVTVWANARGQNGPFPEVAVLGYGAVIALASFATGFVGFVARYLQGKGILPGKGTIPVYQTPTTEVVTVPTGAGVTVTTPDRE